MLNNVIIGFVVKNSIISCILKVRVFTDFVFTDRKSEDRNPDYDQYELEFPIENMKDVEFTKENLEILFREFTKIDLLDDEPVEFDWEGYYKKIQDLEEFEEEIHTISLNY